MILIGMVTLADSNMRVMLKFLTKTQEFALLGISQRKCKKEIILAMKLELFGAEMKEIKLLTEEEYKNAFVYYVNQRLIATEE